MLGYLTDIVFLSGGMFHWTTRQNDKYSLDPSSGMPIWVDDAGNFLVDWVTINVMDSMKKFQNMQSLQVKSSESIHDRMHEYYPAVRTEGRAYLPSVPVISKQMLAYWETLAAICPYGRQDDARISGKYDTIHAENLRRYDTFGYKELHGKLAAKLAKWVEMFPHKDHDDKGMTLAEEEDDGGDDSADKEVQDGGDSSGSAAVYTMASDDKDE